MPSRPTLRMRSSSTGRIQQRHAARFLAEAGDPGWIHVRSGREQIDSTAHIPSPHADERPVDQERDHRAVEVAEVRAKIRVLLGFRDAGFAAASGINRQDDTSRFDQLLDRAAWPRVGRFSPAVNVDDRRFARLAGARDKKQRRDYDPRFTFVD